MPSSAWSLQQAIFAALGADAPLLALLGGARIYDGAPQATGFPYVTFGPATARDWSTGTEAGAEHTVTINVWSKAAGKKEAHAIADAVRAALHDRALTLDGHRLVNLRCESVDVRRDRDGETVHGTLRFRAVTEPGA